MENYGFDVVDLGKDVSPEMIAEKTIETKANLVGLSALMTTTVPAMEETIKLIQVEDPNTEVAMFENGEVNYPKLGEIIEYQIAHKTDAIVICGTTGEASTLSHEEHIEVNQ